MLRVPILTVILTLSALPTQAQPGARPGDEARPHLDYFVSRYAAPEAATHPRDGIGARLMWPVGNSPLAAKRLWAGVYGVYAPREEAAESWRAGVQADAAVVMVSRTLPVQGLVSLAGGVVHVRGASFPQTVATPPERPWIHTDRAADPDRAAASRPGRAETGLTVAPGVGAGLVMRQGPGIRADLRRVWDFLGSRTVATELSAGVMLPL